MYPRSEEIQNSDELRNINCHEYLLYIQTAISEYIRSQTQEKSTAIIPIPADIEELLKHLTSSRSDYKKTISYGNDYTSFMEKLDANILIWRKQYQNLPYIYNLLNTIVNAVYTNPNNGLERATGMVTKILGTSSRYKESVAERIEERMAKSKEQKWDQFLYWNETNKSTPHKMETGYQRLATTRLTSLQLQYKTNMPNIREYKYKNPSLPTEYRFGTQAQLVGNIVTGRVPSVYPMFKSFLEIQQEKRNKRINEHKEDKEEKISPISHIYFNYLKFTKSPSETSERGVEGMLTNALNDLEKNYENVAVITLPADNALISHHLLKMPGELISVDTVLTEIKEIASGKSKMPDLDFIISNKIKQLLYDNTKEGQSEEAVLNLLLQNSLNKLGLLGKPQLTPDEKQALYFHFIKFEFSDFIITKLKPDSFNMSCKDAIDRGGVSSAYYNLMKSIELGMPLDENEFNQALYGAPLLVKGRGMNDHIKLIWNAVDVYLKNPNNASAPEWLKKWSKENSLHQADIAYNNLEKYINTAASTDKFKMSAAVKLKELCDKPENISFSFTREEWQALQQGRLNGYFKALSSQLSETQQKKIQILSNLYNEIINLKNPYPSLSQSPAYQAAKQLWNYANSSEEKNKPTPHDMAYIQNNPTLAGLFENIRTLQEESQNKNATASAVRFHTGK